MTEHPTELDLELLRTGEADDEVRTHVEGCAACRERLEAAKNLAANLVRPAEKIDVPAELDERLLREAREQGASVRRKLHDRRRPVTLLRVLPWAAAACLVLGLGALLAVRTLRQTAGVAPSAPAPVAPVVVAAGPNDLNSDGRVDVIDAYLVALAVDRERTSAAMDRNGDGKVDRADAERLVLAAVSLGPADDGRLR
jgi:predicted anti-sigma-YlaC factor YlaD